MGYNTAFLMIEGVSAAGAMDLFDSRFDAADLFASPNTALLFEEAVSSFLHPDLALGEAGGWAVFWDPSAGLISSGFPLAASRDRRVFTALLGSADSRFECGWFAGGTERPEAVRSAGAGLNIPEWGADEDFVFEVMERLAGITCADLAAALYRRLEFLGVESLGV